ncbi:uncharacterized protein [Henckelia pumila]|uniref:uncharacterized protein n=1 Tax=Henckelia pumila TaxID=405737 RepID=UPI003C6DC56B
MKRIFLKKYFPASRAANIRKEIYGIKQITGESLHEYRERFKKLCASYPQHQINENLIIQYCYEGLLPHDRSMLDAANGGVFVDKNPIQAKNLIENVAANSQQFGTNRSDSAPRRSNEVNASSLEQQLFDLTSLVHQMAVGNGKNLKKCEICAAMWHSTDMCPTLQEETVEQVGRIIPILDSKNPLVNHPPPHVQLNNQEYRQTYHPPPQHPQIPAPGEFLENIVKDLATNTLNFQQEMRESIQHLNTEVGQLATAANRCEVNIPLLDAIKQVPRYAKFLKELCTAKRKHKLKGCQKVELGEQISDVIQRKLPTKCNCESDVNNLDINDYLSQEHKKVAPKAEEPRISRNSKRRPKLTVKVLKWVKVDKGIRYEPP